MEILLFGGLFIAILLLLLGIAKYGIRARSYEDILKEKGIKLNDVNLSNSNDAKKKFKKPKKPSTQQQQSNNSKKSTASDSESEEEEEHLTPVPDPFTNKVRSRYGAQPQQSQQPQQAKPKTDVVVKPATLAVKEIPKAVVKPNQTKIENNVENKPSPKQQRQAQVVNSNGDHDEGAFILHGVKKSKQQIDSEASVNKVTAVKSQVINGDVAKQQQVVQPVKQQVVVQNGHQQAKPTQVNGFDDEHDHIVYKKEIERFNLALNEKEKMIQSLNLVNNKLKSDMEKFVLLLL
jgi:hypothetical protein